MATIRTGRKGANATAPSRPGRRGGASKFTPNRIRHDPGHGHYKQEPPDKRGYGTRFVRWVPDAGSRPSSRSSGRSARRSRPTPWLARTARSPKRRPRRWPGGSAGSSRIWKHSPSSSAGRSRHDDPGGDLGPGLEPGRPCRRGRRLHREERCRGPSKACAVPDREIALTAGAFAANAGLTSAGNRYLRPAENVTVRGAGPGLSRLNAAREPRRIAVVTDDPRDLVDVHPPSCGKVDLGGLPVERCPPAPAMG